MEQTKTIKQSNGGITLISLVITIIIMLILAGITINLTIGDNGIFKMAKKAGEESKKSEIVSNLQIDLLYAEADAIQNGNGVLLESKIKDIVGKYGELQSDLDTIITNEGYEISLKDIWQGKMEKTSQSTINGEYSDLKKVNSPNLLNTGLVAVEINDDGTLNSVDTSKETWYSYDGTNNHWANAKTEDGSMFVWIPRFAYKINADKSIDIVFLKDTSNIYEENGVEKDAVEQGYRVHPAFEDGSEIGYPNGEWKEKITGFWIAKFEAGYQDAEKAVDSKARYTTIMSYMSYNGSSTSADLTSYYYGTRTAATNTTDGTKIKYPVFRANMPSLNYIGISDAYDVCREMTSAGNPYYLTSNVNSHLTKNSEWGAVAYLTQSKYGRNKEEVTINNLNLNGVNTVHAVTGYAGASTSAQAVTTNITAVQNGQVAGSWTTTQGKNASSTKNVYGIYDLSGGLWEWTAGYIATTGNYETYGGSLKGESNEYKSKYAGTSATDTANYAASPNPARVGEAIWETASRGLSDYAWNDACSIFPSSSSVALSMANSFIKNLHLFIGDASVISVSFLSKFNDSLS